MIFYSIEQYRAFALKEAERAKSNPLSADEMIELDPYGDNPDRIQETVVALGNFDGVHTGHRALIKNALEIKKIYPSSKLLVFTFSGLKKGDGFITSNEKKAELLEGLGAELVVIEDFENIRELSAEEFVMSVLKDSLFAKNVFCGYNFRFGRGAEGDAETLRRLCVRAGISCSVIGEIRVCDPNLSAGLTESEGGENDEPYIPPLGAGIGAPSSMPRFGMGGAAPFGGASFGGAPIGGSSFGGSQFGGAPFGAPLGEAGQFGTGNRTNAGGAGSAATGISGSPFGMGSSFPVMGGAQGSFQAGCMIPVSSSDIRKALKSGDIERANLLLGRDFSVCSEVISGRGDGKAKLDAPTINQKIPEGMTPLCRGVYASYVILDGKYLPAVTDIGVHPTFKNEEGKTDLLETHIIAENVGDLYGREIEVFFISRLRDELVFSSPKELAEQIKKDIAHSLSLQKDR